jgi:hypothetical protein
LAQYKKPKRDDTGEPGDGPIRINSHKELAAKQHEIVQRLERDPTLAKMLLLNPVLAFRDAGVELSPDLASHVLHTIQHSADTRARRMELESKLKQELGENAQPNDPAWVSKVLFEKLKVQPLDTTGYQPAYKPPVDEQTLERLDKVIQPTRKSVPRPMPRPVHSTVLNVVPPAATLNRLDLQAPVPKLPPARTAPEKMDLATLFFYKDKLPIIADILELGIIQRQSFPVQTPDSYRKIKDGEKPNPTGAWIKSVTFAK